MIDLDLLCEADRNIVRVWELDCAEHTLRIFELAQENDRRPRAAIARARDWLRCPCRTHRDAAAIARQDAGDACFALVYRECYEDQNAIDAGAAVEFALSAARVGWRYKADNDPEDPWRLGVQTADAAASATGHYAEEEAWQIRHLVDLLWPELRDSDREVIAALWPGWPDHLTDLVSIAQYATA